LPIESLQVYKFVKEISTANWSDRNLVKNIK